MKLKGFTLMELLAGMALSGIVVAASFVAYEVMAGRYSSYQQMNAAIRDAAWLNGLLGKDMEEARIITGNTEQLLFRLPGGRTLRYRFTGETVLRSDSLLTDTFHVKQKDVRLLMQQQAVTSDLQPVEELIFTTDVGSEPEQFYFRKNYPADVLMQMHRKEVAEDGGH